MDVGLDFPQPEIGTDPGRIREYARTAERRGFDHLLAYDHVLGVDPDREGWEGSYDYRDQFHEPLALFSHLAAVTDAVEFVTGVLVLPQRGTPLVAKGTAEVDVLSDGRFRLGAGVGWNAPEFAAMGRNFRTRGRRIEEQIDLLRALWTEDVVEFEGEFHDVDGLGIDPLPVQRPIPVWLGGAADPVLDRIARTAGGWMAPSGTPGELAGRIDSLRECCQRHDRPFEDVGIHARRTLDPAGDPGEWVEAVEEWREFGAEYLAVNLMNHDLDPAGHIDAIGDVADALPSAGLLD